MKDISQQKATTLLRFLYAFWVIIAPFSLIYVPYKLIVFGDAATTAKNIMANELLFRISIVGSLITQLLFIFIALLLYKLFEKVNKTQSILMVVFALVSVPIAMFNTLNKIAVVMLLDGADYLKVFSAEQLYSLTMFFLNLNAQGMTIASIFWGLWLFPLGYLIYKSGYFPKFVGVAVIIAGFGYTIDSFIKFILPNYKFTSVIDLLTIGEMVFVFWIIFKGAKLPKIKNETK
ncbi:MAG: DUF4386 domain-containing protein [Nanoarchaeota archaeon]